MRRHARRNKTRKSHRLEEKELPSRTHATRVHNRLGSNWSRPSVLNSSSKHDAIGLAKVEISIEKCACDGTTSLTSLDSITSYCNSSYAGSINGDGPALSSAPPLSSSLWTCDDLSKAKASNEPRNGRGLLAFATRRKTSASGVMPYAPTSAHGLCSAIIPVSSGVDSVDKGRTSKDKDNEAVDAGHPDELLTTHLQSPTDADTDDNTVDNVDHGVAFMADDEEIPKICRGTDPDVDSSSNADYQCDACPMCDDCCANPTCNKCMIKWKKTHLEKADDINSKKRKTYTMCQVMRHCTADSCWLVANRRVYDATAYLASGKHPGGTHAILKCAGKDATKDFKFHPKTARSLWDSMKIGHLKTCESQQSTKSPWKLSLW